MTQTTKQRADSTWVWKSFMRGYNPIYMGPLALSRQNAMMEYIEGNTAAVLSARAATGHTRAYAEKIDLAAMTPQDALSSSGYCLANAGKEYLVFLPGGGEVTLDLSLTSGLFVAEWFNPATGLAIAGQSVSGGAKRVYQSPLLGDAVLYHTRSKP